MDMCKEAAQNLVVLYRISSSLDPEKKTFIWCALSTNMDLP